MTPSTRTRPTSARTAASGDEEKHYKATTVDDIIGIKDFFGNDSLALAMMMMLDRISKNW